MDVLPSAPAYNEAQPQQPLYPLGELTQLNARSRLWLGPQMTAQRRANQGQQLRCVPWSVCVCISWPLACSARLHQTTP